MQGCPDDKELVVTGGITAEDQRESRSHFPQGTPVECEPYVHFCAVVRTALGVVQCGRRHIREAHARVSATAPAGAPGDPDERLISKLELSKTGTL